MVVSAIGTRRSVHASVLGVVLLLGSGCGGEDAKPHSGPDTAVSIPPVREEPRVENPVKNPLPLDAYIPSQQELTRISQAVNVVTGQCMSRYGFTFTPAPPLPKVGPESNTDLRYGIHDLAIAQDRGYHPAGDMKAFLDAQDAGMAAQGARTPAEQLILGGTGGPPSPGPPKAASGPPQLVNGIPIPSNGCLGEARDKITGGGPEVNRLAAELSTTAYAKSKKDPQVVKAFGVWSDCMKQHGYTYAEPLDATNDPRFSGPDPTTAEISTAVADIGCREKANLIGVWYAAEVAFQNALIERNATDLTAVRAQKEETVRRASAAMAGK